MKKKKLIIGITGTFSSGKDTVANYLVEKWGFSHLSLSDLVREECQKRGGYNSREDLVKVANQLRKRYGGGILAKRALKKMKNKKRIVISSIRNLSEVKELKKNNNFFLLAIDAPIKLRYERAKKRGRIGDDITFKEFKAQEEREKKGNRFQQQIDKVISLADFKIINDKSLNQLFKKVDFLMEKIFSNL
jgi:dephospho-CoA kinase